MPYKRPPGLREGFRNNPFSQPQSLDFHKKNDEITLVDGIKVEDLVPAIKSHVIRDYLDHQTEVGSWRNLPEFPTKSEILLDDDAPDPTNLPKNNVYTAWGDKEKYISTHYKLLRQDGLVPLKDAVRHFRANPLMGDDMHLCVYTQVHIVGYTFSNLGPAPCIEFSYEKSGKRINWKQSKRLQQGTLVALSPTKDKFQTSCIIGIVAARPLSAVEQNPPQIDLFWADIEEARFDPSEEYVMIEARSGYFEANRHMLVAMQKLMCEDFPMTAELIHSEELVLHPSFISDQPLKNLNSLITKNASTTSPSSENSSILDNFNVLSAWPVLSESSLDESQLLALKHILTKRLAIIQGPPGTGKTFVSVCALKIMVDNWVNGDPPIIIAAQTNHALDQLLIQMSTYEPNFVRLGGRTDKDNETIMARTLYEIRVQAPQASQPPRQNYKNARKALDDQASALKEIIQKTLRQGGDELQLMLNHGVLSKNQHDSLLDDEWVGADSQLPPGLEGPIPNWLGSGQIMDPARCGTMNLNLGFEEEDELDFEQLNEKEAEERKVFDDDDIEALKGDRLHIREQFVGKPSIACSERTVLRLLRKHEDLHAIPTSYRGEVYRHLRRELKKAYLESFYIHMKSYDRAAKNLKISRWASDAYMIRRLGIKIIGCTTTGLSKYRGLLASLKPRTLVVEEAAETTEGTIIAGMIESVEQLILVGDHQQLQATCNTQYLAAAPHNLSISMFERLVNNGLPYVMLNRQRRMIPELRGLLHNFYPDLQDHPSVEDRIVNRPPIAGMGGRDCFFFHHEWAESRDDSASRSNAGEAAMIVGFYDYLHYNGLDASKITILTFYNGQRKLILRRLKEHPRLGKTVDYPDFKVFTVDSYQGEENDVILLSLVRNNRESNIGFLENKNRAVVSLSRARRGFYLFGNAGNLLRSSQESFKVWSTVTDALMAIGRPYILHKPVGLPIVCQSHDTQEVVKDYLDWEELNGGCRKSCEGKLPVCGHSCPYKCHPFSHDVVICVRPCAKALICGHGCSSRCGDSCFCQTCKLTVGQTSFADDDDEEEDSLHLSLSHVLGESPPSSRKVSLSQPAPSNSTVKRPPRNISPVSTSSKSSHDWRQWDAEESDRLLSEQQKLRDADAILGGFTGLIIKDVHRPVIIDQGIRVERAVPKSTRILQHHEEKICGFEDATGNGARVTCNKSNGTRAVSGESGISQGSDTTVVATTPPKHQHEMTARDEKPNLSLAMDFLTPLPVSKSRANPEGDVRLGEKGETLRRITSTPRKTGSSLCLSTQEVKEDSAIESLAAPEVGSSNQPINTSAFVDDLICFD